MYKTVKNKMIKLKPVTWPEIYPDAPKLNLETKIIEHVVTIIVSIIEINANFVTNLLLIRIYKKIG